MITVAFQLKIITELILHLATAKNAVIIVHLA